jgi:hypothetical protein
MVDLFCFPDRSRPKTVWFAAASNRSRGGDARPGGSRWLAWILLSPTAVKASKMQGSQENK